MNEPYIKEIKNSYNILIVDDDAMIRQFIDDVLQAYQYQTLHACRGEEAFAILETNKVDLIILDLLLPGKHGFYICDKIRNTDKWKDIPILMITAVYTRSKYSNESREIGADAFMTKPFEGKTLISQVGKLLNIEQI